MRRLSGFLSAFSLCCAETEPSPRCSYVPGFDTHGLPLELKALSALKKPASSLSPQEIRAAARAEAEKGIEIQSGEFKTFGVMGDWENPYRTMDWRYERRQLEVVRDMVDKGASTLAFSVSSLFGVSH